MIGQQLGSYRIVDKLGEGGMGIVYKAVDTSLDRVVAVKSLSSELAKNPDLEQRFRAEAKAQANLNHTNIATLYAFFVQEGTAWMVMEYIEGDTVHDLIQRRGPIPAQEAIPIFKQALLGIGYAHRMGIVHRDIKPSNIMVKRDGIVKVMDFGIAKVMGNRGMTRTGTQMGTAYYMSPEQVVNKGVDLRSDVYSLGITLYEMLTANVPFTGDTDFEVMQAHMQTAPPVPSRFYPYIPKGIENAVLQSIAKSPNLRFQTVEEFGQALEHPDDYVAPFAPTAVAGTPITPPAGATRLDSSPTHTMQPPSGLPLPPGTPPHPMYATPAMATPPTGLMTAPPPPPPPAASGNNKKWIPIAGAVAVVGLGAVGYTLRPKPKLDPIVSQNQVSPPASPSAPQGQIEVPIPLPPEQQDKDKDKDKQQAKTPAAPAPAPTVGAQQQPSRPAAAPPGAPVTQPPPSAHPQSAPPPPPPPAPAPVTATPPVTPAPMGSVIIPAGQPITVRTIGMASTRSSKLGGVVSAALAAPVMAGSRIALPRGAEATLVVAGMEDGITLKLASITFRGHQYRIDADLYEAASERGRKGVLGRVGGLVRKKKPEDASRVEPGSTLTFTLQSPLEVAQ